MMKQIKHTIPVTTTTTKKRISLSIPANNSNMDSNNINNKMYHKTMVQRQRYNKSTWLVMVAAEVEKLG